MSALLILPAFLGGFPSSSAPLASLALMLTLLVLASEGDGVIGLEAEWKKKDTTERLREWLVSDVSLVRVVAREDERGSYAGGGAKVVVAGGGRGGEVWVGLVLARPRRATPGVALTNLRRGGDVSEGSGWGAVPGRRTAERGRRKKRSE